MTDLHQQIANLEADIEALSDAAERCQKGMIVAKIAVGGGLLVFGVGLFGLIWSDPIAVLAGIAATLGGIVFYGSSRSTREHIVEKIKRCEARRDELIDGMDLATVSREPTPSGIGSYRS